jgi:hypothetical protein
LTVKKLPLFAIALVAAIPAYWFIWIVVGGPMWDRNYGTFQVEVFKNKAVLTLLILTLIICALLAFMPFLALIFGLGRDSNELADADADADASGGGTAVEDDWQADAEVDDDPFADDGEEDDEELGSETVEFESDDELDIEGLDEDDIFDEDEDEDDVFGFDDE